MVTLSQSKWALRAVTLVVWTLAAASALYWGLKFSSDTGASAPVAAPVAAAPVDPLMVARLLGATGPQTVPQASLASRFSLQGVVAGAPGGGAALISVDGKPATPFRVGNAVEEGLVLKAASSRQAVLAASADGPALLTLEMAPLEQ
ncbi:MAG: ral secretion pathway protein [Polaromonas sp.]|jgi:general secretion pathway protein C|nr:ral secretion pathway protein [Polaromonas sp.]